MTAFDDERIGDAVFRVMYDTPAITNGVYRIVLTPVGALVLAGVTIARARRRSTAGTRRSCACALGILADRAASRRCPSPRAMRRAQPRAAARPARRRPSTLEEGLTNMLAVQSLGGEARERRPLRPTTRGRRFSRHRAADGARHARSSLRRVRAGASRSAACAFYYIADLVIAGEHLARRLRRCSSPTSSCSTFACVELGALWLRVQESAAGLDRVFFLMDLPSEAGSARRAPAPAARARRCASRARATRTRTEPSALRDVELEARVGRGDGARRARRRRQDDARLPDPALPRADGGPRAVRRRRHRGGHARLAARAGRVRVPGDGALRRDDRGEPPRSAGPTRAMPSVRRAAQLAGADDFVRSAARGLPRRGSGARAASSRSGQKQRLSIARALRAATRAS